ncbi:nuclear transport factor 2 family protein [Spirillospora sp. NPDC048911]|uniref:nuclear transport factor 2 family protein n=1 Tax=Spirillospora sp. NPDC048911 TaxID=3364527 RepID=UPI003715A1C9
MTSAENQKIVQRWAELYNTDVHRMIDESYAEDFVLICPGLLHLDDRQRFHEVEQAVLDVAPDRRFVVEQTYESDPDHVIAECVLQGTDPETGKDWESFFCAILTIEDGKITSDRSYIDRTTWPWIRDQ